MGLEIKVRTRKALIWAALVTALALPVFAAALSPLLAWRDPIYISAGFAGIIGMSLMVVQPLLAAGYLPDLPVYRGKRIHRRVGVTLVTAVVIHVLALWITSPPDVIDALLFVSPTPFSAWGVIAMWAVFAAAVLAGFRRRLRWRIWRLGHTTLAATAVVCSVVHALLIEGTMETVSKVALCMLVLAVTAKVFVDLKVWVVRERHQR